MLYRVVRALLSVALILAGCTPTVGPSPATQSVVRASPSPPTPTPTPAVNPTQNAFPSLPFFAVPVALGADAAAGTVVFNDRSGTWRYEGPTGALAALSVTPVFPVDRHVVGSQPLTGGFDVALFDARSSAYLRLLPQETARQGSASVSGDGLRVAYVTPEKGLRIAFQQPYGNVDGRALARDRLFSTTLISPSGRTIAATGPSFAELDPGAAATLGRVAGSPRDLWLIDVESGVARQLYCSADPCPASVPNGGHVLQPLSWSPDERSLLVREPSVASGVDFDGTSFFALDVQTGAIADLGVGQSFLSWRTWTGPHALAYVAGLGRDPAKRVRLWSAELGVREVTDASGIAISPSFGVIDRKIYFVQVIGSASHVATLDLETNATRQITSDAAWADDAVRVSDDGKDLLVLRRRVADGQLELWRLSADGSVARPLVRFSPPLSGSDAARFGSYPSAYSFDRIVWSR
jgi:hypothetical protein